MVFFKLVSFFLVISCSLATIPTYLKVCKRDDANPSDCVKNSINGLMPKLAEGVSSLKIPSLEPLSLNEIKLTSGSASSKININITDTKVWGVSSLEVTEAKVSLKKYIFAIKVVIPALQFTGDGDFDMNFLVLKYKGHSQITGNFTNIKCDVLLKGHVVKIEGKNYLQFDRINLLLDIGKSDLHLGNIQDKTLGQAVNDVLKDNSDILVKAIKPALEMSLEEKITDIANGICRSATLEELFPVS